MSSSNHLLDALGKFASGEWAIGPEQLARLLVECRDEIERLTAELKVMTDWCKDRDRDIEWWCCEFKLAVGPSAWNTAVNRHADWVAGQPHETSE